MKFYDGGALFIIGIAVMVVFGALSHKFIKTTHKSGKEEFRGQDNPVEELVEDVLEKTTGLNMDLTPDSPEN